MKTLQGILFILAFSVCFNAAAQWVELNNIAPGGRLIADGDDLYYINGTNISIYNPATDTWTAKTSSPFSGFSAGDNWTVTYNPGGKFILKQHMRNYLEVYDIATDTWLKSDLPTSDYEYSWGQGAVYDPVNGKFWTFWTDNVGEVHNIVGAAYDVATGTWGDAAEYDWPADAKWGRMESVNIVNINYVVDDNPFYVGQTVRIRIYDFGQALPVPKGATTISDFIDLGAGNSLASNVAAAFGVQCMAVHDGKLYMTGMDMSGIFLVYDPATDL